MATYNRVSTVRSFGKKALQADVNKKKKEMEEDSTRKWVQYLASLPAQQQETTRQELAQRMANPGNLRPATPSIRDMRYDVTSAQVVNNRELEARNRTMGVYDTELVAYNPDTAHLPSDSYMQKLRESLSMQLASSRVKDDFQKAKEDRLSPWEDWYYNMEGEPDDYDLKAMDTLLTGKEYPSWYELTADERTKLMGDYTRIKAQVEGDMAQAIPYQSQTPMLQARYDLLAQEQERRSKGAAYQEMAANLRSSPTFEEDKQYTPATGTSYMEYMKSKGLLGQITSAFDKSDDAAVLYDYIMNPEYAAEYEAANNYQGHSGGTPYMRSGYGQLMQEEKDVLAAAWAQSPERFTETLSALEEDKRLRMAYLDAERALQENTALTPEGAIPSFMAVRAANLLNTFMYPVQLGASLLGYNDPYSDLYAGNRYAQNVSGVQSQALGELLPWKVPFTDQRFGEFLYNGVSSITDMGMALGVGGLTKAPAQITQLIMSSQAASNALHSALEEDMNPAEAVVRSIIAGGIEALTEKYSIDAILSDPTSIAAFIGKNMLTEGSEEGVSFVLDTVADSFISSLYGHEPELVQQYEALRAQNVSEKEASQQVLEGWLRGLSGNVLLSGLTGGAMGTVVGAQTSARRSAVGKDVSNLGNVSKLVDIGLTMDVNGESNPLARTIKQAEADGKKVSNRQVGRLYETMYRELDEQSRAVVTDTMRDAVAERMVELGDSPEVAQEAADAVLAVVRNEKPSLGQRQSMARAQSSTQVIKEIMFADDTTSEGRVRHSEWVRTADEKASAASATSLRKMGEIRQTRVGKETADQTIQRATVNAQQLVAKKATDKKSMDVELEDGQSAEILQVSNSSGEAKVTIKGADGKKQTVSASDLRIKSRPVAEIVSYLDTTPERMSDEQANLLLHSYTGGDAAEHIADFNDAYAAGFMARELPPSKRMDRRMAQQIAEQGRKDAEAAEQKRQATIGAIATGRRGTVTFTENMADAGSEKALKAVSGRLSDTQKKSVAAIKQLARATGVNFVFFESQADDTGRYTAENGHYDVKTGTLYLDLNSGKNSTTDLAEYAILRTAGHELTHFMEHSSKEGYAALRDFVTAELTRRGEDFDALVVKKMDNAARSGAPLTRAGAISEVVADASEMMLRDTKAIERLAQKDQGLMAKIKGFIQSFVQKVRDAFIGVDAVHEEARVMMQELAEEFQQKWDFALEEAVEQARQGAVEAEPVVQYSPRDFGLSAISEEDLSNIHSRGNVVVQTRDQLVGHVQKALDENDQLTVFIGSIGETLKNRLESETQVPLFRRGLDYAYGVSYDCIRHIQKHFATAEEIADAIQYIFSMLEDHDSIEPVQRRDGGYNLRIRKNLSVIELEAIAETSKRTRSLTVKTAYIAKVHQKRATIRQADTSNGPGAPRLDRVSDTSIPENSAVDNREFAETQESLREQTETPEFKRWFGKSKVVDASGNPKVVYHGSPSHFTVFDLSFLGTNGTNEGYGFYFTDDKGIAQSYANGTEAQRHQGADGKLFEVYLSIQKPLSNEQMTMTRAQAKKFLRKLNTLVDEDGEPLEFLANYGDVSWEGIDAVLESALEAEYDMSDNDVNMVHSIINGFGNMEAVFRVLKEVTGYDGIIVDDAEWGGDQTIYVVFNPSQIKSATDNVGTFDPANPDIRYSLRDMPAISTREYIASMQPVDSMTDSEKWLLGKYQQTAEELREKEASLAEQIRLSSEADTPDEQQKAKNRAAILRTQANRLRNTLSQAERAEGFATIMRTSRDVVQNYLAGRNANQVVDAVDTLEAELQGIQNQLLTVSESIRSAEAGQRAAYARGLFSAQALNQAAGAVKKVYNLRMSTKTLADHLALAYAEMYANDAQQGATRFYAALESLAQDILANSRNRYASPILDVLKENVGSISISDAQEQELRNAGISMSEFRRVVNPVVNVTRGTGSDLNAIVSSAEYYGTGLVSIFSAEDSEGDMIIKLYNVIKEERAKERSGAFEGMSEAESLRMVAVDVMGMVNLPLASADGNATALRAELLNGVERNAAIAKKVDNVIEAAKKAARTSSAVWRKAADVQAAGMQAVAYYRAIDEQRRLMELQEQKKNITQQLRSEAAQKLLDEQTRYRQMIATDREVRKLTQQTRQMQEKIATRVRKLDKLRRQETDYKNIPEAFKPAVDTLVSMFADNFGTMVFDKQRADRLSAIYHKLLTVDGNDPMAALKPFYDPNMEEYLEALTEWAEKDAQLRTTSGTRLEKAQLRLAINKGVLDAVDHIMTIVTNAQNLFYAGKKAKFDAIGTQMGDALKARQDKKTLRGAAGQALTAMDNLLRTGNMTPVYFFEQLGNKVLSTLWDDIRQGQNAYAFAMRDGRETIQGLQQLYHYWDWANSKRKDNVLEITTEKGRKLTFTREQALWVYATWKREQSNEIAATKHLTEGGIVYEGKTQEGGKVVTTVQSTPAVLSERDIARITGWLTDEQKAYADGMVRYLSEDMAELGNRASMEMFGIRKYTESYYFPYRTAGDQLYQSSASGRLDTTSDSRLKHASFTHALTKGASAPLVMGDFSAAVEDHIAHMATYASFVLPIESMNRVLNYKVTLDDGSRATVRSLIEQKYGESAKKYIATLLTDLNGGVRNDNRASGTDYMIRMYKKGAVAASLSTALQQPTSIFRAMAMISPKYIAASTFSKRDWEELTRYSGVAVIKDMGRFDTDVGLSNIDWLHKKHPRGFMERLDAASGFLPEQMDRLTWAHLWSAVKKEQADLHPEMDKQGDAFLALCGERFNDIVDHTQVYDSILSRSQLMRGKDAMSKMTTSFMAEPTLAINMLYNAAVGINKPGGKAKATKVMAAVLTSNIAAAAMAALIQAWNDDDDKRSAQTKYLDKLLENALDNNNPLSMLPVVSDVWSMFQGYDVQRADMSLISEMYKAIQRFQSDSYSPYRKMEELLGTTAKFFGLPAKNLLRDGRRAYNLFTSSFESPSSYELSSALPWAEDKDTAHYEELFLAMHNGDKKREAEIRGYLTDVKDKKPDTMDEGVRDQLKERFLDGSMDETASRAWLKTHMGYDNRKAFETVDRWRETQENKDNEEWSYSIYNDFYEAVESGKNLSKEVKQLLDLGIEAKTLAGNITTEFKPLLLELLATGKTSQAAALQAKILDAYVALGYDREKKLKDVKKWYSK